MKFGCCCKKSLIAKSTIESEYIDADAGNEAVWIQNFIIELGVFPGMHEPVHIYCDDTAAITKAKDGRIKVCKAHTDLNVADPN
jgi:hypothetical protein